MLARKHRGRLRTYTRIERNFASINSRSKTGVHWSQRKGRAIAHRILSGDFFFASNLKKSTASLRIYSNFLWLERKGVSAKADDSSDKILCQSRRPDIAVWQALGRTAMCRRESSIIRRCAAPCWAMVKSVDFQVYIENMIYNSRLPPTGKNQKRTHLVQNLPKRFHECYQLF